MKESYNSLKAPEAVGHYPHAKQVGEFIFLSGVGPRKRGSKDIPGIEMDKDGNVKSYCIKTQCLSVFENVKIILNDSGCGWEDIVDVTVFLTNMKADFKAFNELYKEYFKVPFPTRTTIEVLSLPTPISIELKVVAHKKRL